MNKDVQWVFGAAKQHVISNWGRDVADKLGARLYKALLCEEILFLAAGQNEDWMPLEIVREIVNQGFAWAIEEANKHE